MSKELFMLDREADYAALQTFKKPFIKEKADQVIQLALEGEIDPLKLKLAVKTAIDYYTQIDKGINDAAYDEARKYGKLTEMLNAKVEIRSNPSSYEFSADPVWSELKERLKKREELLKLSAKTDAEMFDGENGETPGEIIPKVYIVPGKENVFITIKS